MNGIDIIIPVHKYNDEVATLLTRCLESVRAMAVVNNDNSIKTDVIIVGPSLPSQDIMHLIDWTDEFNVFNVIDNTTGNLDFCSQVNYAVEKFCKNEFFMTVEFDDVVTPKWVKMALPYIETREKCPLFLPLVEIYDINNAKEPIHYMNEIGWSSAFAEKELGSLNIDALKDYCNFNFTGTIIKRNDFIKVGMLKPSIKLSFGYEMLLRFAHLYDEIYVVPKVGYLHFVKRDDSLTEEYHKTMSQEEGSWWIKLALEEYKYKKDRQKTYSPDEE
jgi:hypothetical protein